MKKILLDTNMYIYLNDNKITDSKVLELTKRLFDSNEYKIVIHPNTKFEIEKWENENQKEIFKSKIAIYKEIKNAPSANDEFNILVGCKNSHDLIDNNMLFAVKRNCVNYLITNDFEIKKKSKIINLDDKVLSIDEALEKFKIKKIPDVKKPPFIIEKYLYELDIDDSFFDSLKIDYKDFEQWFKHKQEQEAKAFVTIEKSKITSFLMLKEEDENEDYNQIEKPFLPGKRLKISTMKVLDTGKKIGETFIKIIVEKALKLNVDEIYITTFKKQEHLIDLLTEYGFMFYCNKNTTKENGSIEKELIFVKKAKPIEEYYPFLNINNRKVFIIPIKEEYHNIIFQESEKNIQLSFEDIYGLNTSSNSLKKAYLCDSKIKKICPGSILLFYSSGNKKCITSLGVVDAVFNNFNSFDELYNLVKKRTAYNELMLKKEYKSNKLVILFKLYYSFNEYVPFDFLLKNQIVNGNIQTIMEILDNKSYKLNLIFNKCKIEKEKYFITSK